MKNRKYPSAKELSLPCRRGEKIKIFKTLRPTEARVRKALFDILGDISGLSFLDLFAGRGSVGIDAVVFGAEKVVFVEKDKRALSVIKRSLKRLAAQTRVNILPIDVFRAIPRFYRKKELFDVVFSDPPYYTGINAFSMSGLSIMHDRKSVNFARKEDISLAKKTLQTLNVYDILTPSGLILIQHSKNDILPEQIGRFTLYRQYKYGDTSLSLYRR